MQRPNISALGGIRRRATTATDVATAGATCARPVAAAAATASSTRMHVVSLPLSADVAEEEKQQQEQQHRQQKHMLLPEEGCAELLTCSYTPYLPRSRQPLHVQGRGPRGVPYPVHDCEEDEQPEGLNALLILKAANRLKALQRQRLRDIRLSPITSSQAECTHSSRVCASYFRVQLLACNSG